MKTKFTIITILLLIISVSVISFEFAAQISAVALKAGVSLDAEYRAGMMVFTMDIDGLMYEASVGGQKI